ncbi:MAG: 50S ribosomal protein L11 methyltransferase [Ruminococcaceae bacterium]|nr:50S ribosomal protein L11 methyltransferase [Oscillospiraceae bacterium]
MAWLEITVHTAGTDPDRAVAALTAAGFSDLVIEDQAEFEGFLEQNRAYWDYIDETLQQQLQGLSRIRLYLEDTDTAGLSRLEALTASLQLSMTTAPLPETDWEEGWKENYPPVPVGKKLLVLPCWLANESTDGRLPVILDPGLTFGTGTHPSTQMVMEAMEELAKKDMRCLDLGSGSGILSITALRLGAKSAIGVDIDPKAEDIARENAACNGFAAPEFTALTGNVTTDRPLMDRLSKEEYDMVLVNIVADVIIGLAPVLPAFVGQSGDLICSGILHDRLAEVCAALDAAGFAITSIRAKEDWRCVTAKRRCQQ